MQLASPFVEEKVKDWDLENPNLMLTLGYLSGYIDAAYQMTQPLKYNEKLVESTFDRRIAKYVSRVSGVDSYLKFSALAGDGSSIGGMQGDPQFMTGTMAGGSDFVNFRNEKRLPLSLAKLLQGNAA